MTQFTRNDVLKLSKLARIDLTEDEADELVKELGAILDYVEQLQSVDVKGLEPTLQVTGLKNVTREDVEKNYGYKPLDLLKNVPETENNQIKTKRMVG